MATHYNFSWFLEVGDNEEEYDVHFLYYPPMRSRREPGTGLMLAPDDPSEVEITGIFDSTGVDHYDLLHTLYAEQIEEKAWEYLESLRDKDY